MAIYQKDRNFYRLISEINIDVVPLRFVRDITCTLNDGTKVILTENDFKIEATQGKHIEVLLKGLPFYNDLKDLQIRINYDSVEKRVESDVKSLLSE